MKLDPKKVRCSTGGFHVFPQLKGDENRTCLKCGYRKPKA